MTRVGRPRSPEVTERSHQAYRLRAQGLAWSEVSDLVGLSPSGALACARRIAERRGLAWPPRPIARGGRQSAYYVGRRADGIVRPGAAKIVQQGMAASHDDQQIAEALADWSKKPCSSRTAKRIRSTLRELRAPSPGPAIHESAIRELHSRGLSTREIARVYGCTYRTAQEYLYRMSLRANR